MKDHGYYTVQGWMINHLPFKGNELAFYALVYGFTQDGRTKFKGGYKYIADTLKTTRRGAINICNRVVKTGYIKSEVGNDGLNYFWHDPEMIKVVKKVHQGSEKSSPVGSEKSSPINNSSNNINNNRENGSKKEPRPQGSISYLNSFELKKELAAKFPSVNIKEELETMQDWLKSKGVKKKDYAAFARNWCRRSEKENKKAEKRTDDFVYERPKQSTL